jgi:hypothetical protein
MKLSLPIKLATVATIGINAIAPLSVNATQFDEFAVDQSKFIAVAVPYNYRKFKLAIIEQVPGQQSCWTESGNDPTTVNLSLLNFDHTNACRKAVDTNGYSLRYNGKDDKVEYILDLVEHNGKLQLIADHQSPSRQDLIIGTTDGIVEAPMKINLAPNWQFTKRLYQGGAIEHIYMSNNPNPQILNNARTLAATNDPPQRTPSQEVISQPQPLPPKQSDAKVQTPAPTPAATVQEFIDNILTPLSQAVYESYNSLFTNTSSSSQSAPNNE